jgi:hypothetical protein
MSLVTFAPVGAWLWKSYGNLVVNKATGPLKNRWNKFRWEKAAEVYCAKVRSIHGSIQIMGMAEPVALENIFTDVYMLDKPTALRRYDIQTLLSAANTTGGSISDERINGLRLVVEKQNLFILGKPGAGKTTFLKYIALKAAERVIDKVPIFISLKQWADSGLDLMQFISQRFDVCSFPEAEPFVSELLESGNAIVLFDGLDEVNLANGQRDIQADAIENFIDKNHLTQCLVTCRIAASDYAFQRFTYVEIADFSERQIQRFIFSWFRNSDGEKDEHLCRVFLDEFQKDNNRGLRELARTPLLLTLLCLAFSQTLTFPRRRAEIYKEAIDALLKKWDASRRIKRDELYRQISLAHKENLLSSIASATFGNGQYFIPLTVLESLVQKFIQNVPPHDLNASDSYDIIKAIEAQHGILVERARDIYSFSHLTFQEYFTAKYIADDADPLRFARLVHDHMADERWREVFLLLTSLLPNAWTFIKALQTGANARVASDERLTALLRWTDTKTTLFEIPWVSRVTYMYLELDHQPLGRTLSRVTSALRNRLANYHDTVGAKDFTSTLDYSLCRALALVRDISMAISEDRSYAGVLANDLDNKLNEAKFLSESLGLNELAARLERFSLPADEVLEDRYTYRTSYLASLESIQRDWQETAMGLRELILEYRNLGKSWDLDNNQESVLADYLIANMLLQDCLEIAFISPSQKSEIENGLFRG